MPEEDMVVWYLGGCEKFWSVPRGRKDSKQVEEGTVY